MYFYWQIGLSFRYEPHAIIVNLPFIELNIATTMHAYGYYIFGWSN